MMAKQEATIELRLTPREDERVRFALSFTDNELSTIVGHRRQGKTWRRVKRELQKQLKK